jgi:hypothetical protein
MSDDTKPEFDPRFSPAFQRGFDPASPASDSTSNATLDPTGDSIGDPAVRARLAESAPPAVPNASRIRVAPAPGVPAPHSAAEPVAPGSVSGEVTVEPLTQLGTDADPVPTPDTQAGRNPFLLALGIIAVVLVGAGIWLFVRSGAAFNSREVRSQGDYMSLDATIHTAPFIALLGAVTAIGLLFVFALRWRRRR